MRKVILGIISMGTGYFQYLFMDFVGCDRGEVRCLVKSGVVVYLSGSISPLQTHYKAQFLEMLCLIRYLNLHLLGFHVSKKPAFFK